MRQLSKEELKDQYARQLFCLVFAEDAFQKAKSTAEYYIEQGFNVSHTLHYTFASSAVVTYAKSFIQSETMHLLPKKFTQFSSDELRATHDAILHARNTIYAHTDASVKPYSITVGIVLQGEYYNYSYRGTLPRLRGIIFPELVKLCAFQIERINESIADILEKLYPSSLVGTVLKAERSHTTEFEVRWIPHKQKKK